MGVLTDLVSIGKFDPQFREHETVRFQLERACEGHGDLASFHVIGESEEGRELYGIVLGKGAKKISLIAGAHSDEPVGPETLRIFIVQALENVEYLQDLFSTFTFIIVPHINPDGEARNRSWITSWPDVSSYIAHSFREPPGRDVEFGFPSMRPENSSVSGFLRDHGPYDLHMSLHGMGFAEGGMLLIDRRWTFRTQALRDRFVDGLHTAGVDLHDQNRKGEKGFYYIEPGFATTPESEAMRLFFQAQNDEATASLFHQNSMEFVRSLGGNPLSLVTELPLFSIEGKHQNTGVPETYLQFKQKLPELRLRLSRGKDVSDDVAAFSPKALPLGTAIRLQLLALELGLEVVNSSGNAG